MLSVLKFLNTRNLIQVMVHANYNLHFFKIITCVFFSFLLFFFFFFFFFGGGGGGMGSSPQNLFKTAEDIVGSWLLNMSHVSK